MFQHSAKFLWLVTVFAYLASYSQASFRTLHTKPAIFLLVRKTRPPHRELRALLFSKKCVDSLAFHRFAVLIQEDLKVQPFADEITKATLSPQLFKDTECWSGQDLKPCLEQLAPLFYFAFSRQLFNCSLSGTDY